MPASTWCIVRSSPGSAMSAAAKAWASVDRPEPGGPVMSHACVIEAGSDAASLSAATAAGCPHTSPQGTSWSSVAGDAPATAATGSMRTSLTGAPDTGCA